MKLNLFGPSYHFPTIDINNQRCVNMFPISPGTDGRGQSPLIRCAGLSLLIDLGNSPVRCMGTVGDYVYVVTGSSVYQLTVNYQTKTATSSLLGTMTSSEGVVYMAANPTQIMWVDGSTKGYIYTPGSGVFQEITASDADFTGGSSVAFIDGYFVVSEPSSGRFFFSAGNNGLSWNPLSVATAETNTDNIAGLSVVKGELWVIGDKSTEIWYDAANVSGSPFSLRTGLQIQIGCGAPASIVSVNDLVIWLDNRGFIVQSEVSAFVRSNNSGYNLKIVSTDAVTTEFLSYTRRDDAIGMTYNDRGHIMYQITFPTVQKTWVYDYSTQTWHERSYYNSITSIEEHHIGQFATEYASLHLMAGIRDGKIYLSSSDYFTDNGSPIYCTRVTPTNYDGDNYKLIGVDRVEVRAGIGTHSQTTPQIGMRYSHDGGHTWSDQMTRNIGNTGEYAKSITWNRLGVGREWVFEFRVVENMEFTLIDAVASVSDVEK